MKNEIKYQQYSEPKKLSQKSLRVLYRRGPLKLTAYAFEYLVQNIKPRGAIVYGGKKFKVYRCWKCSLTPWRGEREAELPICWDILSNSKQADKLLEVGNVLTHYYPVRKLFPNLSTVDKYEKDEGVINEDIFSYNPKEKYDLIISISTLEHVGYDEIPRDPPKAKKTIKKLAEMLSPGGKLVFTFDIMSNDYLRKIILEGNLKLSKKQFLIKIKNTWYEDESIYLKLKRGWKPKLHTVLFIGTIARNKV